MSRAPERSQATLLVIALAVFGMFLPTLIISYAFSDDYPILSMADGLGSSPWFGTDVFHAYEVNGRPLAGLLINLVFSAAGTIDNLRFVRLFAVVGIMALAFLLHWALVRSGIRSTLAAPIVVLVCSLPAFQVYASWAVLFTAPYAAILAGCASLLAVSAVNGPRNLVADRLVTAFVLLLAALLIYQPAAMFFWVFLAVALVGAVHESNRALRLARVHLGVAAIALALAFLVLKLGVRYAGGTAPNASRNSLTHDVVGKARWFFEQPLYQSLNLFDLTPSLWLATVVATVATAGISLLLRRRGVSPMLYVGIATGLIPLAYLPNLVVQESVSYYRTQVSISALIALYACLGAGGIWFAVRDWLRPRVTGQALIAAERLAWAVAVAFVAASAFLAAKNVTTLFVEPQSTELRVIRSEVAAFPPGVPRVAFVRTGWRGGMTKLVRYDEFGLPSSATVFVPRPSVLLILREEGRLAPEQQPIVDTLPWYTTTLPTSEPLVDVRGLWQFR